MVSCFGEPAGRVDSLELGDNFRYTDDVGDLDLHSGSDGQRIACRNGIGPGVTDDYRKRPGDYVDEPQFRQDRKVLQHKLERDGWHAGLYVGSFVGQPAGRFDAL